MATAQSIDRPFDVRLLYARIESVAVFRAPTVPWNSSMRLDVCRTLFHTRECRLTCKVPKNKNAFSKKLKKYSGQFAQRHSSYFYLFRHPEISIN